AREFRSFLKDELVQRRGCAVIPATHNAGEAFHLSDRVAVLDPGRLLASGIASQLSREFLGVRYLVTTTEPDHEVLNELSGRGVVVVSKAPRPDLAGDWHDVIMRMELEHDAAA